MTRQIVLLPIMKHVPVGRPGWTPARCPKCQGACWMSPERKALMQRGAEGMCTECALREARKGAVS